MKWVAFLLLAAACTVWAGCSPSSAAPPTPAVPSEAVIPGTGGLAGSPTPIAGPEQEQAVIDSLTALGKTKSFRASQTILTGNQTLKQELEMVLPDRLHIKMKSNETIVIGTTMYTRRGTGAWTRLDESGRGVLDTIQMLRNPDEVAKFKQGINEVQFIGIDTVDGNECRVYQYRQEIGNPPTSSMEKLWVGAADRLPRKFEINSTVTIANNTVTTQATGLYRDFNTDIQIEPPVQ